jgi:hypothetical protein
LLPATCVQEQRRNVTRIGHDLPWLAGFGLYPCDRPVPLQLRRAAAGRVAVDSAGVAQPFLTPRGRLLRVGDDVAPADVTSFIAVHAYTVSVSLRAVASLGTARTCSLIVRAICS